MKSFQLNLLAAAVSAFMLSACGDAETTIVEQDPIEVPEDDHDHDDGYSIESAGRLAILASDSNEALIYDLDDNSLLGNFALTYSSSSLSSSADFRYALISTRAQDQIEFIDGGLWQEDHGDHLHAYQQAPTMSGYTLNGSRPTHLVKHDGKLAVFYDGNAETGEVASVQVVTDTDIANQTQSLPVLNYSVNMHGVAEPSEDYLIASIRRDDSLSTSANKVLPDQVGVYHLHDGEYEHEHIFEQSCPDLHGAAQNEEYQVFGCSDGILVTQQNGSEYNSAKIANISALDGLRVGSIYGHHELESFIGVASVHGGGAAILVHINPHDNEMETIDWQPQTSAQPLAYSFTADGEHFLILDNQGYLTLLSEHTHDDHSHWEFDSRIDISEQDIANMPEGLSFSMTISQNDHIVYIADPIAQHILQINLESGETTGEIELNFAPKAISWLGIAASEDEHDH
ncbi:5-methyltetrahydrofolate--homocysteine methyltransferase [Catenovulum sp. 2E275]|uniref:5-methyltetrahydrofolate--homocysteine methyltransferase n=1 Tax=Catenovulum sp. 2E275 TaxID=2980497 RepID=UPI0021D031D9|nr:5-methyltetrahydrofolate--homocysteine methyltransferase [Catenovulum sp. 2E275]MCU4677000.1 5-methyltetrahydrofolate--homocysteine methyltransferase [Catenovulum sp. 2E275]